MKNNLFFLIVVFSSLVASDVESMKKRKRLSKEDHAQSQDDRDNDINNSQDIKHPRIEIVEEPIFKVVRVQQDCIVDKVPKPVLYEIFKFAVSCPVMLKDQTPEDHFAKTICKMRSVCFKWRGILNSEIVVDLFWKSFCRLCNSPVQHTNQLVHDHIPLTKALYNDEPAYLYILCLNKKSFITDTNQLYLAIQDPMAIDCLEFILCYIDDINQKCGPETNTNTPLQHVKNMHCDLSKSLSMYSRQREPEKMRIHGIIHLILEKMPGTQCSVCGLSFLKFELPEPKIEVIEEDKK